MTQVVVEAHHGPGGTQELEALLTRLAVMVEQFDSMSG